MATRPCTTFPRLPCSKPRPWIRSDQCSGQRRVLSSSIPTNGSYCMRTAERKEGRSPGSPGRGAGLFREKLNLRSSRRILRSLRRVAAGHRLARSHPDLRAGRSHPLSLCDPPLEMEPGESCSRVGGGGATGHQAPCCGNEERNKYLWSAEGAGPCAVLIRSLLLFIIFYVLIYLPTKG